MKRYPAPRRKPGNMNKTESEYSGMLEMKKVTGEVIRWVYEGIKFKLAQNTFYTPDFMVTFPDRIEIHEVKGFWEDDARVKIKVAAVMFPEFRFVAVRKVKKQWEYEVFE